MDPDQFVVSRTQQKLLDAGEMLVLRQGFEATSVNQICAAAGLTKGSFFHYYETKREYGLDLMRYYYVKIMTRTYNADFMKQEDPVAVMLGYLDFIVELVGDEFLYHGCLLGNMAQEMASRDESFAQELDLLFGDWKSILTDHLQQAADLHQLDLDSEALAHLFLSIYEGSLMLEKGKKHKTQTIAALTMYQDQLREIFENN